MNNRQNGRRRGRGGNGSNQRGGNPGNPNSGNRIDNRARGNANQLYEKYKNLARDAQMSGDRVNTEYYLQFADHYFRVLSESRARFEEANPGAPQQRRIQPVDSFDDYGDEEDFADEGEPIRSGDQNGGQNGQQGGRNQSSQDGGQRDGNRFNGGRDDRYGQPRRFENEGQRNEGNREGSNRDDRGGDVGRDERGSDVGRDDRGGRYAVTGSPIANDLGEDSPDGDEPTPIVPRRRGRPRRDAAASAVEVPAALEADRLPPSLVSGNAPTEEGDEAAPRRRRRRSVTGLGGEGTPVG